MAQISDRKATYEVIKRVSGQTNILTIPRIYMDITGNVKSALFLSQCVYWSDKMGRTFYKSYKEWEEEIGLTRWDIDIARKECKGIITTELRKANGAPTLHYTVEWDVLYEEIEKLANGFARDSQMDLLETRKSLTETTTEITTYIESPQKELQKEPSSLAKKNGDHMDKEEYLKSIEQSLMKGMIGQKGDYAQYPEVLWPVVERMEKLWFFKPPVHKSKQYGFWIQSCHELLEACAEFGVVLLDDLYRDWKAYLDSNGGAPPYPVSSPKSLVSAVRGKAAMLRGGNKTPFWRLGDKVPARQSRLDV